MSEGKKVVRDYEFNLHVQQLRAIRRVAFVVGKVNGYKGTEKGLLPLPLDNEKKNYVKKFDLSEQEIKDRLGAKIKH